MPIAASFGQAADQSRRARGRRAGAGQLEGVEPGQLRVEACVLLARGVDRQAWAWRRTSSAAASVISAARRGHLGGVHAARPLDVDGELADHPAGPARQQHDPVGEAGGLAHVVGDEHDAEVPVGPQPLELVVEQVAGHGVEGAEGLVHEEDVGLLGEGPGDGDPLAHAAGQLVGPLVAEPVEVDGVQELLGLPGPLALRGTPAQLEGELDVAADREPREQRRLLEHQGDPAAAVDGARRRGVEAGDEVEQRALAAARGADEAHELAGVHLEEMPSRAWTAAGPCP